MINKKLQNRIHSYNLVNERTVMTKLRTDRGYMSTEGSYAPEEGWNKDTREFYDTL
jgi:hypothetical protein